MNNDEGNAIALHEEMMATLTILQAQIHALIQVSQHCQGLLHFYQQRMERATARGLGLPVSDRYLEVLAAKDQEAREEIRAAPGFAYQTLPPPL